MENFQNIRYTVKDNISRITINRPPLNILDVQTIKEIISALTQAEKEQNVHVLIVAGEGDRAFSAGVDIGAHLPDKINKTLEQFHRMFYLLVDFEKPTIAVVDGLALGGGCELAMACDIIIASDRAKFGQPEIKVGAIPTVASALLPKLIGRKQALEMLFTGDILGAAEAKEIGLVNKVFPAKELNKKVDELLGKMKDLSPTVLSLVKKAVYQGIDMGFKKALDGVTEVYLKELMSTEDAVEGLKAFLEKRKPEWKGK